MEERRGESSDAWMGGLGKQFEDGAHTEIVRTCDEAGIDPTLSLPERVARLQDIHQGSPLMAEERERKNLHINTFKQIYGDPLAGLSSVKKKPKSLGDDLYQKIVARLHTQLGHGN